MYCVIKDITVSISGRYSISSKPLSLDINVRIHQFDSVLFQIDKFFKQTQNCHYQQKLTRKLTTIILASDNVI